MPSRFRLASQATGTYSGLLLMPPRSPSGPRTLPNLVAMIDLVALALDALREQLLVLAGAVGVGGVEQVDAELDGAVDGRDGFDIVRHAVFTAHAGAAKPDRRHDEALRAELSLLHHLNVPCLDLVQAAP